VAVDSCGPYEYDPVCNAGNVVDDSAICCIHLVCRLRMVALETER